MSRQEFLRRLEELLYDIPENERREAMEYYRNYFDDADPGMEEQIIRELGSPEKVAASIKKDLFGENWESNQNFTKERQQMDYDRQRRENKRLRNVLLVVALVFLSPVWIGLLGGAFGLLVGAIAVVFGLAVCGVALVGCFWVMGFVLTGLGIAKMFTGFPAVGLIVVAIGVFLLALGMLALTVMAWMLGRILPWTLRAVVRLCKRPFQKRGVSI